mgnify:CR=1 FL=1
MNRIKNGKCTCLNKAGQLSVDATINAFITVASNINTIHSNIHKVYCILVHPAILGMLYILSMYT